MTKALLRRRFSLDLRLNEVGSTERLSLPQRCVELSRLNRIRAGGESDESRQALAAKSHSHASTKAFTDKSTKRYLECGPPGPRRTPSFGLLPHAAGRTTFERLSKYGGTQAMRTSRQKPATGSTQH